VNDTESNDGEVPEDHDISLERWG